MCPTKWHNFRQPEDCLQLKKIVTTCILSKRLAPPSGKFSTRTPIFLYPIYRPRRVIQSCEGAEIAHGESSNKIEIYNYEKSRQIESEMVPSRRHRLTGNIESLWTESVIYTPLHATKLHYIVTDTANACILLRNIFHYCSNIKITPYNDK